MQSPFSNIFNVDSHPAKVLLSEVKVTDDSETSADTQVGFSICALRYKISCASSPELDNLIPLLFSPSPHTHTYIGVLRAL